MHVLKGEIYEFYPLFYFFMESIAKFLKKIIFDGIYIILIGYSKYKPVTLVIYHSLFSITIK